jgi:hypothetical protein
MPTGLKAMAVYLLGCAVFIKVFHYLLHTFLEVSTRTALYISLPVGIVSLLAFIFAN